MTLRATGVLVLAAAGLLGTVLDRPPSRPPVTLGGYRVLAADFHIHSTTWSDGGLTPFGIVLEARRRGLDAVAITGHNQVSDAKAGRWFSALIGGPTVLVGQEIISPGRDGIPDHDLIAVGIESAVNWRDDIAHQIEAVHRQGGAAIAAHPTREVWVAYSAEAMKTLDGSEVCQPMAYIAPRFHQDLDDFSAQTGATPIGSSDFHAMGPLGLCRTYLFATDDSSAAIVAAIRAHRTVVYGVDGKAYGDPALVRLAESVPRLRAEANAWLDRGNWLDWTSRGGAVLGLLLLLLGGGARVHSLH